LWPLLLMLPLTPVEVLFAVYACVVVVIALARSAR
jgi:hypothetical protein